MAETAGMVGGVRTATGSALDGVREWSLDWNADPLEITDFNSGSDYREFLAGLKGWSGSWGGFDLAATPSPAVGASQLMYFFVDSTDYYAGSVLISSVTPGVTVDGVNTITYNFTGTSLLSFSAGGTL